MQFIAIFVHSFQLLFRECNYPHGFMWWIGFHAVLFWFLFADFYKNTYGKVKSSKAAMNGKTIHSESKANGTNGYCNGNGMKANGFHKSNGVVSNGTTNGYVKATENGYKNGTVATNGHTNGVLVHRTATSKDE